jgi:outer membrane protein TolC
VFNRRRLALGKTTTRDTRLANYQVPMIRLLCAGLLLAASALAGCAQQGTCVTGGAGSNPMAAPQPTEMRAQRGSLSPDLSALGSYQAVDRALSPPPVSVQYRVLRAEEVQCLAAANAPLAKLYASESEAVLADANPRNQQSASVQSKLMAYRAVDERNKAAGTALELYYSLAEAEANRDILNRSIDELDRAVANLEQLKQSGLKIPPDRTALQRQKLDLLDRQIQLNSALQRMQGQLQQLCGFEADPATHIWPQADLTVTVVPLDVPAAISAGLTTRADLGALRMLSSSTSADTLPAARSGMQTMGMGLGASAASRRLFGGGGGNEEEAQARQSQVAQAQSDMERTISREVSEAAQNIETQVREIAVAKERGQVWQQRMADLKDRRQTDGVTAFDLNAAQLELLRAEGDTLHRVIAWKIAQAKLKQAQGLLAAECGYSVPDCGQ